MPISFSEDEGPPEADDALPPAALEDLVGAAAAGRDVRARFAPVTVRGHEIRFALDQAPDHVGRAWITCPNPAHVRCFKSRNMHLEPDRASLYAYLLVWAADAHAVDCAVHSSRSFVVPRVDVERVAAELRAELGLWK